MRRALFAILSVLVIGVAGCSEDPKDGTCENNDDCAAQSEQGYGAICVEGQCQECGQDEDCQEGFLCQDYKCVPKPECETDVDCGEGRTCDAGTCVEAPQAECASNEDCGEGMACEGGMCIATAEEAAPVADDCMTLADVNFGFDEYTLTYEAQSTLEHHANCFKATPPTRVTIAGNCDERGTTEYNLQLGQRRAESAKQYLVDMGVSGDILNTVSYGEEQPMCSESTEDCWAKNRRDGFTVE